MKKNLTTLFLTLIAGIALAGSNRNSTSTQDSSLRTTFTIDMFDTVVFDLSQDTVIGNQVSFPVYFLSDDTINALDFSLKFSNACFTLDTIINLTNYLVPVYNINMGTLYFTSYSLQAITNDTPLISMRFNMSCGPLCSSDLDSILVYLNGDPCSVRVINCLTDKISELNKSDLQVNVYPNPTKEKATVKFTSSATENYHLNMKNAMGQVVFSTSGITTEGINTVELNLGSVAKGVYMLNIISVDNIEQIRLAVQ